MRRIGYQNFDLEFHKTEGGYKVKARSFAGEATQRFVLPFTSAQAQEFVVDLENGLASNTIPSARVKAWGGNLYEAIFANDVRAIYKSSLDLINAKGGSGLRILLHLQDIVELSHLPWEFLYHAATNQFLCHNRQTPMVRYLEIPKVISPLTIKLPLRILVVISSPIDLPPLEVDREKNKIQTALGDLVEKRLVAMAFLEVATVAELQRTLRRAEFHIFHFIGHGNFEEAMHQGLLAFENEDETADYVKAEQAGAILSNHPSLRLVVLNSCKGGRTSLVNPLASTAATLVQHGIPAVAAMQFSISDSAAVKFASEFYAAIADGLSVDMAVTEARVGIFSEADNLEWGTPVLFMRSTDGALFDLNKGTSDTGVSVDGGNNVSGEMEPGASRGKPGMRKPRGVTLAIYALVTLLFGVITFFILAEIPKSTIIETEVFARRVSFAFTPEVVSGQEISLLRSGFWAQKAILENFQAFELRVDSLRAPQTSFAWANPVTISPQLRNGRVSFYSPLSDLSLQDVVCDSGSNVSIGREEASLSFQIRQSSQPPQLSLSLGENVRMTTQGCRVMDGAGRDLTPFFENEVIARLPALSRALNVQGRDGALGATVDSVESEEGERIEFLLSQRVQNLHFMRDEYVLGGKVAHSTIDSITIKKNQLLAVANFKSQELGDLEITAEPNRFVLDELSEDGKFLKARALGRLKSLQIGRGVKDELVPKYLSLIAHHPAVSVTMTWVGWFLTVVLPVLLKAKFGRKNDVD